MNLFNMLGQALVDRMGSVTGEDYDNWDSEDGSGLRASGQPSPGMAGQLFNPNPQALGQAVAPDPVEVGDITVTGSRPPAPDPVVEVPGVPRIFRKPEPGVEGPAEGYRLGNNRPQDKLPFLRRIQDAMLMAPREKPYHRMTRDQERLKDAMDIYRVDKAAGLRAINDVDPAVALKVENDELDMDTKRLTAEGNLAYKEGMLENAAILRQQRVAELLGRFGRNLNEQNWPQLSKMLYERAVKGGFEGLIPPPGEKFDANWATQISNIGSSAYNQQRLEQIGENQETNAALRGESNEIARIRAQNSRLLANIAAERQRIQEERLRFEQERETWRRSNPYPKAGSGRRTGSNARRTGPTVNGQPLPPGAVPLN